MYSNRTNSKHIVKQTVMHQYRNIVNAMAGKSLQKKPKQGWIRTVRTALGMSGAQLGERTGLSRNRISVLERKEADGDITLNQLRDLAEQLNCDLTYALVPRKSVEDMIDEQATRIAVESLESNTQNMFLEAQALDEQAKKRLFEQLKQQLIEAGGRALWNHSKV
ncbi:mobile mystery protein A [Idiomarina xiamenensis 10-D-4]|uniref:Mobile mystery protein A n=2 Tax=Idiomarina xiamenensis TaxID=1207041 RepID=K2KSR8_9GAMM|nr:mobile mystery protein A [Idiomarina xiamenensis 10-D-4]